MKDLLTYLLTYLSIKTKQEFACEVMGELCRSIVKLYLCPLWLLAVNNRCCIKCVIVGLTTVYKLKSLFSMSKGKDHIIILRKLRKDHFVQYVVAISAS